MSAHNHVSADIEDVLTELREEYDTAKDCDIFNLDPELLKRAADEIEQVRIDVEKLKDPVAVHINMLRGGIAKPSWANIKHLYPEQFTDVAQPLPERIPVKLTESAHRLWMAINGHDINDFYERAEYIIKTSLDGLQVGPSNRASVKALLVEHFEQIAKAASQPSPAATVEPKQCACLRPGGDPLGNCVECDPPHNSSAASEVPFLTGEALRQSLRGSDCLAAEAEVNGRSEEQELERLAEIAERAKQHWLAANRLAAEPQPTAGSEPAAWLSTGDNHRGLWREKPDLGDGFQVQPLYLRDEPQGVLTRDAMVAAILEQKYPHRTDRQKWIDAFKVGDHGRIPGMEYRYATSDAFRFSDAILALPRPEHS